MITFALTLASLFAICLPLSAGPEVDIPIRYVKQHVVVSNVTALKGTRPTVKVLPLYKGYKWAITTRWDDPTDANKPMSALMKEYGFKGTFMACTWDLSTYPGVLADGHGVGSHSLSHPNFPELSYPAIWEQIMKSRIDIESALDSPVNSWAFPYNSFKKGNDQVFQWDMYRMLRRSGYIEVADQDFPLPGITDMSFCKYLPWDGSPIEDVFEQLVRDDHVREVEPNLTYPMHAWAFTEEAHKAVLEASFAKHAHNPEFWYCTQTEYGAYRFQYKKARIVNVRRMSSRISFDLIRPSGLDTNSPVPLSLSITGVGNENATVKIDGDEVAPDARDSGSVAFSVPIPDNDSPPTKVDAVSPKTGECAASADFPGLGAGLDIDKKKKSAELTVTANGPDISDIVITYRMPLGITPGVARHNRRELRSGRRLTDTLRLQTVGPAADAAEVLCVCQVDFLREGHRGRLYVTRVAGLSASAR